MEKREDVSKFLLRERKLLLKMIPDIKTIDFWIKWFHIMRGVKIKCFLILKIPKKTYTNSKRFLVLG
jgi:hypothetical protein